MAAYFRKLESAYAQIANLSKYGINEENLEKHLISHEFLESMKRRVPPHMIVDLNKELRQNNLSRTLLFGLDYYLVLRKFITEMAVNYDSFQEPGVLPGDGSKPKAVESEGKEGDITIWKD